MWIVYGWGMRTGEPDPTRPDLPNRAGAHPTPFMGPFRDFNESWASWHIGWPVSPSYPLKKIQFKTGLHLSGSFFFFLFSLYVAEKQGVFGWCQFRMATIFCFFPIFLSLEFVLVLMIFFNIPIEVQNLKLAWCFFFFFLENFPYIISCQFYLTTFAAFMLMLEEICFASLNLKDLPWKSEKTDNCFKMADFDWFFF